MTNFILGAGSYLGSSFFNFLLQEGESVYGVTESEPFNERIYKSKYQVQKLQEIINEIRPVNVYDFKTYKVSSNKSHFTVDLDEMIRPTSSIIKSLESSSKTIKNVYLLSTVLLNENKNSTHPYLKLKYLQENLYKKLADENYFNYSCFRVPNVLGKNDMNFSRLVPYIMANYIVKKPILLNSKKDVSREYVLIENLNKNLKNGNIEDLETISLSNEKLVSYIDLSLEKLNLERTNISWGNNKSIDEFISKTHSKNSININTLENRMYEIIKWYIDKSDLVAKKYYDVII